VVKAGGEDKDLKGFLFVKIRDSSITEKAWSLDVLKNIRRSNYYIKVVILTGSRANLVRLPK